MTTDETAAQSGSQAGPLPFDTTKAHQARVYNYLLGGKDNYAADRAFTEELVKVWPGVAVSARANRAFLGRAVRFLAAEAGIRQFLDIGTGIPAGGNTHEVAQAIAPESRVVYVDYDPVVLAHARALLDSSAAGATKYVDADLRDTGKIIAGAAELLDFAEPVAITMLFILHAVPDADDPYAIVRTLLDTVPSGSYLVVAHGASDLIAPETASALSDSWTNRSQQQVIGRSREQVARFFTGTDLVEPGLVTLGDWRPGAGAAPGAGASADPGAGAGEAGRVAAWGGVGRKR